MVGKEDYDIYQENLESQIDDYIAKQREAEEDNDIKYRTCSWYKTAALLGSEYICLAAMSFPTSYATLGIIPALIISLFVCAVTVYSSLVLWEFCLRHPHIKDMCDAGQVIFGNKRWGWYFTATMFIINNMFIQGTHVLTGAEYLNTMTNHSVCTVVFTVIVVIINFIFSLPRTFSSLSWLAMFASITMFIAILLGIIFAGIEDAPGNYDPKVPITWSLWSEKGTTFVEAMNAVLNIIFLFAGQVTFPSFIAEMEDPRDFPKALYLTFILSSIVYALSGAIMYVYVGKDYLVSPALGSLNTLYTKIAFSFTVPTIVILGVLFSSVTSRFIFFRVFRDTKHLTSHTVVGWASWAGLVLSTWILAFIVAEAIPIFNDLLSLMSSLFSCWFGFLFWGIAYFQMRTQDFGPGWWKQQTLYGYSKIALNIVIIGIGLFLLGPGTYATVMDIIIEFQEGTIGGAFTCADNGL